MKLANSKYLFWGLERGSMASDGSGDDYRWLNLCPMDQKRCFESKEILFLGFSVHNTHSRGGYHDVDLTRHLWGLDIT